MFASLDPKYKRTLRCLRQRLFLLVCLLTWASAAYAADGCAAASFSTAAFFPAGNEPVAVKTQDFNGDGRPDLALANSNSNDVSILLSYGLDGFSPAVNYPTGSSPVSLAVGDFNGDGKADLVSANYDARSISVLFGTGTGTFGAPRNITTAAEPYGLAVADFNGDGSDDVAVGSVVFNSVTILLSDGAGGFTAAGAPLAAGGPAYHIIVARLDGDALPDLVVSRQSGTTIFLGNGAGDFRPGISLPAAYFFVSAVGDFNGDDKTDLVGSGSAQGVSLMLGDGTGNFFGPTIFGVSANSYGAMTVGDFNGDGKADVAAVDSTANAVSILLGDGAGRLGPVTSYGVGGWSGGITAGDFNADGKIDLAVASRQFGVAAVLYGRG